jgi:hypothetical protein
MNRLTFQPDLSKLKLNAKMEPLVESSPQAKRATMDDFWISHGWVKRTRDGWFRLSTGKWKNSPCVRREAIRFLVETVLKKDCKEMITDYFHHNRLNAMLANYYHDSVHEALTDAGYQVEPWELPQAPMDFFTKPENRKRVVLWLVEKLGKEPCNITQEDFHSNGLAGFLNTSFYGGSPYRALKEAGHKMHPWEMIRTPQHTFQSKTKRVKACKWLVQKLGKEPRDIVGAEFTANRLAGLLSYHKCSPYAAFLEARLVTKKDEEHMKKRGAARRRLKRPQANGETATIKNVPPANPYTK